jgi:predicted nucleic acid-binding protein
VFVVDTNVLVYAADRSATEHARCRELLVDWRAQATPWYLTWGIVYEFAGTCFTTRTRPL